MNTSSRLSAYGVNFASARILKEATIADAVHARDNSLLKHNGQDPDKDPCIITYLTRKYDHEAFAAKYGLHISLAYIIEALFEISPQAPVDAASIFAVEAMNAIPELKDTSTDASRLAYKVLADDAHGLIRQLDKMMYIIPVRQIARLHARIMEGDSVTDATWSAALQGARKMERKALERSHTRAAHILSAAGDSTGASNLRTEDKVGYASYLHSVNISGLLKPGQLCRMALEVFATSPMTTSYLAA